MYIRKKVRVLIADDHKLFRDGLIELLSDEPDIEIAGEAENGYELIEKYFSLCPDIILADISMPVLPGTKALSEIKKKIGRSNLFFYLCTMKMHISTRYTRLAERGW